MCHRRSINRFAQPADAGVNDLCLELGVDLSFRLERGFGIALGYQLDALKQPPAADIADMRVIGEPIVQRLCQLLASLAHVF